MEYMVSIYSFWSAKLQAKMPSTLFAGVLLVVGLSNLSMG